MSTDVCTMTAVILAGGLGTRIRSLLADVPKPMAPVAGRPFLEWVVRYLGKQGVRRCIVSTGHLAHVVEKHFKLSRVPNVGVQCVVERDPLGTGGAFLHATRCGSEDPAVWLVLNGDSLVFADLKDAASAFTDPRVDGVIVGRTVSDASRYGTVVAGADGTILGFEEKRPGAGVINAGIYFFRARLVGEFPAQRPLSMEREVFPALTARGACLKLRVTDAPFLDIGTPESLPQAEGFIRQNIQQFIGP